MALASAGFLKQKQGFQILLSAMFAMSSLGFLYIWSVFVLPLEKEFGWNRSDISMIFTLSMLFFAVGVLTGGFLNRRMRVKRVALLSLTVILPSLTITSYSHSLPPMLIFYGFMTSLFCGVVYNTAISTCNIWFNKSSVAGLLQTCLGGSTILLSLLAAELLKSYDWRVVFRMMGLVFMASLLTFFYFVHKPSDNGQAGETDKVWGINWRHMLRVREFWLIWLLRLIIMAGGLGIIGHAVPMNVELGVSYDTAILALGLLSMNNALGRVICGLAWDYLGVRRTTLISVLSFVASFLLLTFTYNFPNTFLTVLACCLAGFAYGSAVLFGVSSTREFFGMKYFSENYGIATTQMIPASFAGPYLMSTIKVSTQSYYYAFLAMLLLGAACFVCMLFIRPPHVIKALAQNLNRE